MASPKDYETRRQNAFRRLGTDNPACSECGYAEWECLELHHVAGQKHHGDLAIVCRNCHRKLSDSQLDHPPIQEQDSVIGRYLIGLADLLAMIANRLKEFGLFLIEMAEGNPPKSGRVG